MKEYSLSNMCTHTLLCIHSALCCTTLYNVMSKVTPVVTTKYAIKT